MESIRALISEEREMVMVFMGLLLLAVGAVIGYGSYDPVTRSYPITSYYGGVIGVVGIIIFIVGFFKLVKRK